MKKFYKIQIFFVLVSAPYMVAEMFQTIDELKEYAQRNPVSVPIDNQDYLNPEYVSYLQFTAPTMIDNALMTVGLKRKSLWKPQDFIDLMRRVTQRRKKDGLRGAFVRRQDVSQDFRFLVWGNLQGSFHSLVQSLMHLVDEKIIDKNLKIIAPNYFMVFLGNVIDRSVYSLETLAVVLRLMDANPTRVFYVKGDHEVNGKWRDFDTLDQLQYKVAMPLGKYPPYSRGMVAYSDDVDSFFDTLPLVLYLTMKTVDSIDFIRLGHFNRSEYQLNADELKYIANASDQTVFTIPLKLPKERPDEKLIRVVALTQGSSDIIPNYNNQGLRLLIPDRGTTTWSILSAQNDTYETLYKFINDSYAQIDIDLPMRNSTIKQHYQDAKNRTGFKTGRVYNMFSGQADEQFRAQPKIGVLGVGSTIDASAETAILGTQIRDGMGLAINKQNQQGIASGTIVSLTILDDEHVLSKVRRNIQTLIQEYRNDIILGVSENLMKRSYYDLIKKNNTLVLFPVTSDDEMRSPTHTNIIHFGPSYKDEADIITRYILDTVAPTKITILYQEEEIGEDGMIGVRAACKDRGFNQLVEIPFSIKNLDFKDKIAEIKKEDPDALGIFCSSTIAQEFIRQVGIENISRRTLFGLSAFGSESFRKYCRGRGLRIMTTHLVPDPFQSDLLIAQDYRKEADENNIVLSPQVFEAYVFASLFVEALRITKGTPNANNIKQTLESIKNYEYKGLKLSFNPETREISDAVWLDRGDGSAWRRFTAKKYKIDQSELAKSVEGGQYTAIANEIDVSEPAKPGESAGNTGKKYKIEESAQKEIASAAPAAQANPVGSTSEKKALLPEPEQKEEPLKTNT